MRRLSLNIAQPVVPNKTKILFVFLLFASLIQGCGAVTLAIEKKDLIPTHLTLVNGNKKENPYTFLRVDFSTSTETIKKLPDADILQLRMSILKNEQILYQDIASGPFLRIRNEANATNPNTLYYSAYFFKQLLLDMQEGKPAIPLKDVDFDTMSLTLIHPIKVIGEKYRSNTLSYSKNEISAHLLKTVQKQEIVIY